MHRSFHLPLLVALLIATGCAALLNSSSPSSSPSPTSSADPASPLQAHALANVPLIKLAWPTLPPDATGYAIERARADGGYIQIASVSPLTTSYSDTSLAPDTLYSYRVRPAAAPRSAAVSAAAKTSNFRVFDCTYFTNKPDLKSLGIEDICVAAGSFFYLLDKPGGGYDWTKPNQAATRQVARRASDLHQILCIDIEHLPEEPRRDPPADVQNTLNIYTQILAWLRSERPDLKLGFYASFPRRDYWTPVNYLQALDHRGDPWWDKQFPEFEIKYKQWQAANDLYKSLADKSDYIFPSIYTFNDNPTLWPHYAKANILEAKRYNKPVIPFIWMDYHNSTSLIGQKLPSDFWLLQLTTCRKYADGLVIWGGVHYQKDQKPTNEPFSDSAPWWPPTKQFLTAP
ncbi:MAG: hypothetical protein NTU53_07285 [Planctomycetota bacterium]|nr:hypothetical protein [Planctomycetota bacterium]